MIELFLNAIPNVLAAMIVGTTAGGLKLEQVMSEREVAEKIQTAFWASYDSAYTKERDIALPCEEALIVLGSSKAEVEKALSDAKQQHREAHEDQRHH